MKLKIEYYKLEEAILKNLPEKGIETTQEYNVGRLMGSAEIIESNCIKVTENTLEMVFNHNYELIYSDWENNDVPDDEEILC